MSLLQGPLSVTRFRVVSMPEGIPDFDDLAFVPIGPGSEILETSGFLPLLPDAEYDQGTQKIAFKVRTDQRKADPKAVRELAEEWIHQEVQMSHGVVPSRKKIAELKRRAKETATATAPPRIAHLVEGAIVDDMLYLDTTSNAALSKCIDLLRKLKVIVEPWSPWIDHGEELLESELVRCKDPGTSVRGCRFLRALLERDREIFHEPESGAVRYAMDGRRHSITGEVGKDLVDVLGDHRPVEFLSAKLLHGEEKFTFLAESFRLSGVRMPMGKHGHWTEQLTERLEQVEELFALLDRKYVELMKPPKRKKRRTKTPRPMRETPEPSAEASTDAEESAAPDPRPPLALVPPPEPSPPGESAEREVPS